MARERTRTIRVRVNFIEDCLDKIIEIEKKNGRDDTSYSVASEILRKKILLAGGIK